MDGWIGGWGRASSPTPGRRQHLELDPGAASASRRSPSRPARPPSVPPVHPPPDPTHQPTTSPKTLTRWTMHLLNKTTQNIILQCWLKTQLREPCFEERKKRSLYVDIGGWEAGGWAI